MLRVVADGSVLDTNHSSMLNSSILITGALIVSTGDCSIVRSTISVGASIQRPSTGNLIPCNMLYYATYIYYHIPL